MEARFLTAHRRTSSRHKPAVLRRPSRAVEATSIVTTRIASAIRTTTTSSSGIPTLASKRRGIRTIRIPLDRPSRKSKVLKGNESAASRCLLLFHFPRSKHMAKAKRKSNGSSRSKSRRPARSDAIELLKTDHREVTRWFEQFKKARGQERKVELVRMICTALKVHTTI